MGVQEPWRIFVRETAGNQRLSGQRREGDDWVRAVAVGPATPASIVMEARPDWLLRPATLPPQIDELRRVGLARQVEDSKNIQPATPVRAAKHIASESARWN